MGTKIPLGEWIQVLIGQLTTHFDNQFRVFSDSLSLCLEKAVSGLAWFNPLSLMVGFVLILFVLSRNWMNALLTLLGLLLILNLGYWHETLETVSLVVFATLISAGIGIPVGIVAAHHPKVYRILQPVLDLMQTIPTFVYLIPTLMLFGLGMAPGVISTVIFAMPAPIRMTYLGISGVPHSLLEVGEAFGATSWQRLFQIELPHALPTIRAGISQCVMLSLSMVVIAALVGADGLGKPVIQALNTVNIAKGFEAGIVIVIVAIILDRVLMIRPRRKTPVKLNPALAKENIG
ncbi:MAG: choline ABC transporter permease subunit [Bdellovibrio sp.]|nr:choline ABC transporter permease subunit [Bdellovibrio sp.]